MYVILNFSNIESTIAERNVDRYFENQEENEIDLGYLFHHTGTDAIGQIKRLLNARDESVVERVKEYLLLEKEELQNTLNTRNRLYYKRKKLDNESEKDVITKEIISVTSAIEKVRKEVL